MCDVQCIALCSVFTECLTVHISYKLDKLKPQYVPRDSVINWYKWELYKCFLVYTEIAQSECYLRSRFYMHILLLRVKNFLHYQCWNSEFFS